MRCRGTLAIAVMLALALVCAPALGETYYVAQRHADASDAAEPVRE